MRNPRRWTRIALGAVPLGATMTIAAFALPPAIAGDLARAALFALGASGVLFGSVGGWQAWRAARAQASLARGEDVLARWRVDAATWRAFVERDRDAARAREWLPNELPLAEEVPAAGIEVTIGQDAIDVGGSVHMLPRHGAPEVLDATLRDGQGGPDVAELHLRYPPVPRRSGGMSDPLHTRLSFPVAPGAWRDARRAIGHFAMGRPGKASFFHGRGDGSDPEDLSTCVHCGYRTHAYRSTCPECGGSLLSKRWTRRFGMVLIALGAAITLTMGVLLARLSPMLAHPGVPYDDMRFDGTPLQALAVWAILGTVFVFGATATGLGFWQVLTGRRNMRAALVMVGIFSALVTLAHWL